MNNTKIQHQGALTTGYRNTSDGRFNKAAALLTALAIFAQEAAWNFYDAQVPVVLRHYTTSAALIGLMMGLDNFIGLFLQPWIAHKSDSTSTRWGRRLPYLLVGAPVAAIFYALIPWANSLPALIFYMFSFALVANAFKSVTETLVSDFQTPEHRGKASAVAKMATGLTAGISASISYFIVDSNIKLAFLLPAIILVVGVAISAMFLDENKSYTSNSERGESKPGSVNHSRFRDIVADLVFDKDRTRLLIIFAIFATAGTWSAVRSQVSPYALEVLGLTKGQAGTLSLPGGIAFLLAVVPIAILSDKYRRLLICKLGGTLFSVGCLIAFFHQSVQATTVGIAVAAVGYAAFAVNGVVIVWNMAPSSKFIGAYTGIYTIAAACGATVVPALVGLLVDITSWHYFMLHSAVVGLIAVSIMSLVPDAQVNKNS